MKSKIATLNTCGANNKLEEAVEIMKHRNIKVLGIAYTQIKDNGVQKLHLDYALFYSGVNKKHRSKHGV